ncbi:hypothetical protein ASPZODRAFT_166103 [Penicilliopsis zonata CBS 506.65]|uniref:Beta-lactamase-related domain-containing protein n=1 Tax=Penicilliopsis zonata CBS 506.65 TaxID=1073090 RepID=A0A1L9SLA7_9EURO|nr:hypothetical protein ASPZODRAFT_166103 [Penicilliopsis zonata CBS 506.65]OJJ48052.1 hypothetical protein ASPZODRAFT_166103 [Penicilliopsis zonata CBS 506.65]
MSPHLSSNGVTHLKDALDKLSSNFPGCFLTVVSPTEVIFNYQTGPFDVLQRETSPSVDGNTIIWASSVTRFVVSFAYLQLVDQGLIALDTPMSKFSPELESISRQILRGFDEQGDPIFEPSIRAITLRDMLNGTSGFDAEYGAIIKQWKAIPGHEKGFINTCKAESLIHTPPTGQPGEVWKYGSSNDWLSLLFPRIAHQELEEYLQEHVFRPLAIQTASFYPHDDPNLVGRIMPLRWITRTDSDGKHEFEPWTGQQGSHFLPTGRANIEYPTGGAALYASPADIATLLQNVLAGHLGVSENFTPLLKPETYRLLLSPDLEGPQVIGVDDMLNAYFHFLEEEKDIFLTTDDVSVTLGSVPMIVGKERKGGWGRRPGSAGWGGAAGTDFYIDPATGIAVVFSTQLLPGSGPVVKGSKKIIERALFEALEQK